MPLLPFQRTLATLQADGPSCSTAARVTALNPQALRTLDPSYFDVPGKQLLIKASGKITSVITTPGTARLDVDFTDSAGTHVIVFDGLAMLLDSVAGHTNVGWYAEILLTARTIGSTGNLSGQGIFTCEDLLGVPATAPKGVLSAILPWNSPPAVGANFDMTKSQLVDLRFTQTVGSGGFTVLQYSLIAMN